MLTATKSILAIWVKSAPFRQNRTMTRWLKWTTGVVSGTLLITLVLWWGAQTWLSAPATQQQLTQEVANTLGVKVSVGQLRLLAWPPIALELADVVLHTKPSLRLKQLRLKPSWSAALHGRLALSSVYLQDAEFSQTALEALVELQKKKHDVLLKQGLKSENTQDFQALPERLVFDQVTWVSSQGNRTTVCGQLRLNDQGWVDDAALEVLQGSFKGTHAELTHAADHWVLNLALGGGTVKGAISLQQPTQPGAWTLAGKLATRNVALTQLTASPTLSGQLEADTVLSAQAATLGGLLDGLKTQSHFTVRHAVVHGIDLARAVSSVGLSRGGQTPLDVLAGQLSSQGRVLQLSQLVASSGVLSATGSVRVAKDTTLSGRIQVVLAAAALGNAVGVPLEVGGTLAEPQVSLTRSALIGAALGTAVLPGVGTGAGASLGERLGTGIKNLFGQ